MTAGETPTAPAQTQPEDTLRHTTDPSTLPPASPFVGREAELKQLGLHLAECREQKTLRMLSIVGEPGIGKSRLARHFLRTVAREDDNILPLFGNASAADPNEYTPFVQLIRQRFAIQETDGPEDARQKIATGVALRVEDRFAKEVTHLLASFVGAPFDSSPVIERLTEVSGQLDMRTYIAIRRLLQGDAEEKVVVLCLDALECCDQKTSNLIHYLADGLHSKPVLILAIGRPTLFRRHPQWGQGEFSQLRLDVGPLAAQSAADLLKGLLAVGEMPSALASLLHLPLAKSPRALYDLVRFLRECGALAKVDHRWQVQPEKLQRVDIPRTHEEIIRARLQLLPPTQIRTLQQAAVVGEVFWRDSLVALRRSESINDIDPDGPPLSEIAAFGNRTRTAVSVELDKLCVRGMVVAHAESSVAGERQYRFAYPPLWDVAYEGVPQESRQGWHKLIAQWLELRPEGRKEEQQATVGWHLQRAGDGWAAAARYRRAAESARSRYLNNKAVRLYERALSNVGKTDLATRIHLWHDLGSVYQLQGDYDAALDAFERMVRLGWVVASRPKAAVAYNKMGRVWRQKGDTDLALEYLKRGLEMFSQAKDQRGIATSLDDIGQVYWMKGNYDIALSRSATALEMRRALNNKRSIAVSLSNIGNIEKDRGLFDEAESCHREAMVMRREVGDRYGSILSKNNLGAVAFERGKMEDARQLWQEALNEADQIGALPLQVLLLNNIGEAHRQLGRTQDARPKLSRALSLARKIDDRQVQIDVLRNLALVELHEGNSATAEKHAQESLKRAEDAKLPGFIGRAKMALGEIHAATLFDASKPVSGESSTAGYFSDAVDVFRRIGNKTELAKSLRRLGEYYVEQGDVGRGRGTLQEAASILTELGTSDVDTLKAMIQDLS
jgi:tetratricopeptide (TPR) repeat protein